MGFRSGGEHGVGFLFGVPTDKEHERGIRRTRRLGEFEKSPLGSRSDDWRTGRTGPGNATCIVYGESISKARTLLLISATKSPVVEQTDLKKTSCVACVAIQRARNKGRYTELSRASAQGVYVWR